MILSEKLSLLRKQNGFSQEELADKLNIARQTVSKWENGLAIPELDALIGLSKLYGITLDMVQKLHHLAQHLTTCTTKKVISFT